LILGIRVVPIVTALLLLVQALFFAHGGLTTLGANTLTLGVVGPSVTLGLYWFMTFLRTSEKPKLIVACFVGSLAVYLGDSFLLAWSFADKQPFMTTFSAMTLGFLPVQGPLSLLEGFISAGVIVYLARQRSDLAPTGGSWRRSVAGAVSGLPLVTATLLVLSAFLASPADASSYEGLDDSLFSKTAENLGVQTKDLTPWISGEVELAIFSFGFLIAGFIAGRAFTKWRDECRSLTERVGVQIDAS
jgi:cobalt/nickel transport system permease protein